MSETIASMTHLEFKQDEANRTYWYDAEQKRKISEEEALGFMGVDSTQRQEPVSAIWHNHDLDIPVTITGVRGRMDNEDYLKADETGAGIPRSELEFIKEAPKVDQNEYIRQLEENNRRLEDQNRLLHAQVHNLEEDKNVLESRLSAYDDRLSSLQTEFDSLKRKLEAYDREVDGFGIGDAVAKLLEDDGEIEEYERGYKVTGFSEEKEHVLLLEDLESGETSEAHSSIVVHEDELDDEPAVRPSEASLRRTWNRTAGRIGGIILGRQAALHNGAYNLVDRHGRVIEEDIEVIDGYTPESERTGAMAIGGAALVGAGVLIGYLIWGRHGGPNTIVHNHTVTVPSKISHPETTSIFGIPGPNSSGRHVDFFNSNSGHRLTGVDLPQKLHLKKLFGHSILTNDNGRTVVGRLKDGLFDRQGNLSQHARAIARAKGYLLTQGNLARRYMTYIWAK